MITALVTLAIGFMSFENPVASKYFIKPEEQKEVVLYENKIKK